LSRLRSKIVAGGANNQLATDDMGDLLRQKGVLYAPDFVLNAGGIIKVCYEYLKKPETDVEAHVREISDTLAEIFARADKEGRSTAVVAEEFARSRFQR
jgi:leucine dehydrogenase